MSWFAGAGAELAGPASAEVGGRRDGCPGGSAMVPMNARLEKGVRMMNLHARCPRHWGPNSRG
jgi:hypothetical protein